LDIGLKVIPGTSTNLGTLASLLRRGFEDEPVQKWLFPNKYYRTLASELWFRGMIKEALGCSTVWCLEDYSAVAVWFKPDFYENESGLFWKLLKVVIKLNRRTSRIKEELDHELTIRRPKEPHWYLAAVATEKRNRSQGRGSLVLQPVLSLCDQEHVLAYLETSNPLSIKFYESLGFDVWASFSLHEGPEVWCMGRRSPAAGDK
jgi:GNAT superfamily N-acetyltransferase